MTAGSGDFDAMVSSLEHRGFPRATAEREVRAQYPEIAPAASIEERTEHVLEKAEQALVVKLFRAYGVVVYSLSQARASKQTPGLPDLWCMHPDRQLAWWFEVKRAAGGRLSPTQQLFRQQAENCHVRSYVGDRRVAARVLVDLCFAKVGNGPCGIVPFHESGTSTPLITGANQR